MIKQDYSRAGNPFVVAQAEPQARAVFIRKTYGHLALAILAFILIESLLLSWSGAGKLAAQMTSGYMWLAVLGGFMGVSFLADKWARSEVSQGVQYLGLFLFVIAEAVIFLPLLFIAVNYTSPDVIINAGIITGLLFAGLTATVFITRKDFSFLKGILTLGFFVAMGIIVASIVMGFSLGLLFSSVMVLFAAGSILYTTSNILHHYRADQHVAASLAIFAGVALLFWYVLQVVMSLAGRD
jgi:FtsH-binding integral membrane protein